MNEKKEKIMIKKSEKKKKRYNGIEKLSFDFFNTFSFCFS
jgi:hypothetical protein